MRAVMNCAPFTDYRLFISSSSSPTTTANVSTATTGHCLDVSSAQPAKSNGSNTPIINDYLQSPIHHSHQQIRVDPLNCSTTPSDRYYYNNNSKEGVS